MPVRERAWDPPQVVDRRVRLPSRPAAAGWQPIISGSGHWSSCDLWVQLNQAWADVVFRVLGTNGSIETIFETKLLSDIENPRLDGPTVGLPGGALGTISGILVSIRGRVCDQFRAEAQYTAVDHIAGHFRLECWGDQGAIGGRDGRMQIQPFAAGLQQVSYPNVIPAVPLAAGVTVLFPVSPTGGRTNITRVAWTSDDVAAQLLTLQTRNPTTAVVSPRAQWRMGGASSPMVEQLTYPLRSDRGDSWEANLLASTGDHRLNVSGYID